MRRRRIRRSWPSPAAWDRACLSAWPTSSWWGTITSTSWKNERAARRKSRRRRSAEASQLFEGVRTVQLGMVGLGRMGQNMVVRMAKAGHQIVVYDRDPKVVQETLDRVKNEGGKVPAVGASDPKD